MAEPTSDVAATGLISNSPLEAALKAEAFSLTPQAAEKKTTQAWPAWLAGAAWAGGCLIFLLTQPLRLDPGGIGGLIACLAGLPALAWLGWRHQRASHLLFKHSQALLKHLEQFGDAGDAVGGRAEQLSRALERRTRDYLTAGQALTGLADRIAAGMNRERAALQELNADLERRGQALTVALSRQVAEMTHATETANTLIRTHTGGLERLAGKITDDTRILDETLTRRVNLLTQVGTKGSGQMQEIADHLDAALTQIERACHESNAGIQTNLQALDRSRQAVSDQLALLGEAENRSREWMRQISAAQAEQRAALAEGARGIAAQAERNQAAMAQRAGELVARIERIDNASRAAADALDAAGGALERQALRLSKTGADASTLLASFTDDIKEQTANIGQAVDQAQSDIHRLSDCLPTIAKALQEQAGLVHDAIANGKNLGENLQAAMNAQGEALERKSQLVGQRIEETRSLMSGQTAELARLIAQMNEAGKQIAVSEHNLHQASKELATQTARSRQDLSETVTAVDQAAQQGSQAIHRQAEQMIELFTTLTRGVRDATQLTERSREGLAGLSLDAATILHNLETSAQSAADRLSAMVGDLESYTAQGETVLATIIHQQASLTATLTAIGDHTVALNDRSHQADAALGQLTGRLHEALGLLGQGEHHMAAASDRLSETTRHSLTRLGEGKGVIDQAGASLQQQSERAASLLSNLNERWLSLRDWAEQGQQGLDRWGRAVAELERQIERGLGRIDAAGSQLGQQQERVDAYLQTTSGRLTATASALDRQATALALLSDRIGERLSQASDLLAERIERLDEAGARIGAHLSALAEGFPQHIDSIAQAGAHLQTETGDIRQVLAGLRDDTIDLAERIMAVTAALSGLRDAFTKGSAGLDAAANALTARFDEVSSCLSERMERVTGIAHRSIDGLSESVAALQRESDRANQVGDHVLARIESGTSGLSAQGAQIRIDLSALANDLLTMTGRLTEQSQAVAALSAAAERAGQAISRVGEITARLPEHLAALEAAGGTIGPALDRLGSELSERMAGLGDLPLQARAVTDEAIARIENLRAKTAELVETARAIREEDLTIPGIGNMPTLPPAHGGDRFLLDAAGIVGELESLTVDLARPLLKLSEREVREKRADRAQIARRLTEGWTDQLALETRLRHGEDRAFRRLVDSYIEQFERLFAEQAQSGVPHALDAVLLSSDQGRLYVHLARAIGRL